MHNVHTRNTVRYYILIVAVLAFLFFSNDFGLTDVQKTAIVMAVGVDREEDEFILTSQIALPQSSKQGNASQAVQLVSRGKTVAEAFEQINAKTGWYPKLVFCKLIILGDKTAQQNVFDALDYFLLDEYLTDGCLVATCDGLAKDLLNTTALVDPSSSLAMTKVLSSHAQRVGTVLPTTLREFSADYFSDSKSGYLPILKTEPQQEKIGKSGGTGDKNAQNASQDSQSEQSDSSSEDSAQESSGGGADSSSSNSSQEGAKSGQNTDKPVFSAQETALFVAGKRVGTLTAEETFAFNAVKNELRLASYSVEEKNGYCTLSVKKNSPKRKLTVGKDGSANFKIELTMTAGLLDNSSALPLEELSDFGDVPGGVFAAAEKKLSGEIKTLFEKTKALGCDIFGVQELLVKYEKRALHRFKDKLLSSTTLTVDVSFQNIR
ncbi:MAG: hypothetical protein E7352_05900 [Clostridiales bacterium]|nr:hypothetical protein [Clostridiales bacterium]